MILINQVVQYKYTINQDTTTQKMLKRSQKYSPQRYFNGKSTSRCNGKDATFRNLGKTEVYITTKSKTISIKPESEA